MGVGLRDNETLDWMVGPDSITFFVLKSLPRWAGYRYTIGGSLDFPDGSKGGPPNRGNPASELPAPELGDQVRLTNCVGFTWATLTYLYPETSFDWDWYKAHMLYPGHDFFAGIAEVYARGISDEPKTGKPRVDGWHLVQGWSRNHSSGHSFFVCVSGDRFRILESSGNPKEWGAVHWTYIGPACTDEDPGTWLELHDLDRYLERFVYIKHARLT